MIRRPPSSTLFPYPPLFRSDPSVAKREAVPRPPAAGVVLAMAVDPAANLNGRGSGEPLTESDTKGQINTRFEAARSDKHPVELLCVQPADYTIEDTVAVLWGKGGGEVEHVEISAAHGVGHDRRVLHRVQDHQARSRCVADMLHQLADRHDLTVAQSVVSDAT